MALGTVLICAQLPRGGSSTSVSGSIHCGIAFTYSNLSGIVLRVRAIQPRAWLTWNRFRTGAQAPGTAFRLVMGS